jgi:heme/copper-type cytochrome/quinol oxidase subunit 4
MHVLLDKKRRLTWIFLAILAILAAGSTIAGFMNALSHSQDFEWSPSRLLLWHQNPYRLYLDYTAGRLSENPFLKSQLPLYPASGLIFLWPYAALPWRLAQISWATSNILFGFGSVFLVWKLYLADKRDIMILVMLLTLFLASTPYRITVGNGQHGLFSMFFFLSALYAERRGTRNLVALLLAVSWLKYSITVPLSLLFMRRDRIYTLLVAGGIDLALTIFAARWTGSSVLDMLYQPILVIRSGLATGYIDLHSILKLAGVGNAMGFIVPALLGAITLWIAIKRRPSDELLLASLLSLAASVMVVHLLYDFIVLLFPLTYAIRTWTDPRRSRMSAALAVVFIAAIIPIWYLGRPIEALYHVHPGLVSKLAMWLCWAWVVAGTYVALGFCSLVCIASGVNSVRP